MAGKSADIDFSLSAPKGKCETGKHKTQTDANSETVHARSRKSEAGSTLHYLS